MKIVTKRIEDLFINDSKLNNDKIMSELIALTGIDINTRKSAMKLGLNKEQIMYLWNKLCDGRNTRELSNILTMVMNGELSKRKLLERLN